MTVAYGVANVDGLKEDEAAMLIKELKSYKFANDPEQYQEAVANPVRCDWDHRPQASSERPDSIGFVS